MTLAWRSTDVVRDFGREVMPLVIECDWISGRGGMDASSILGIYSLNLSKPLELVIRGEYGDDLTVLDKYKIQV